MVRKIVNLVIVFALVTFCLSERASAYSIYQGNISTTQLTYFKDIANNLMPNDEYVFFRSGQYDYTMIVGDLDYSNGVFSLVSDVGKDYTITQSDNYNSTYEYVVSDINEFNLVYTNELIYSNLGEFPELIERGTQYETLILVAIFVIIISSVCKRIWKK